MCNLGRSFETVAAEWLRFLTGFAILLPKMTGKMGRAPAWNRLRLYAGSCFAGPVPVKGLKDLLKEAVAGNGLKRES